MADFSGDCAREGGLRYNSAISLSDNLLSQFNNRIDDLYQSSQSTINQFFEINQSMNTPDISMPTLEAKAMELLSLVERLEAKSKEVEALLQQVDIDAASMLVRTLPEYRELTETESRTLIVEYCEGVRMKFMWLRPQSLATKKSAVASTVQRIKERRRTEIC